MKIAIIGAGEMGSALARDLAAAGHTVVIGSRSIERARGIAQRVGAQSGSGYRRAAESSEIVVLTVPWQAVREIVPTLPLDGKVLIDATNPYLDDSFNGRESVWSVRDEFSAGESGASHIQQLAPGASVVKAFNHIWAVTAQRGFGEIRPAVFVCGDDPSARSLVKALAAEIGYDPHDCGGLEQARWLEALTPLVVALDDQPRVRHQTRTTHLTCAARRCGRRQRSSTTASDDDRGPRGDIREPPIVHACDQHPVMQIAKATTLPLQCRTEPLLSH